MFERLLNQPPYSLKQADKEPLLLEGLNELTRYHYEKSPEYKRIIDAAWGGLKTYGSIAEVPYLPVSLFKEMELKSTALPAMVMRSSGTTGQRTSRIIIDNETARRQSEALVASFRPILGSRRLPFLAIDTQGRDQADRPHGARRRRVGHDEVRRQDGFRPQFATGSGQGAGREFCPRERQRAVSHFRLHLSRLGQALSELRATARSIFPMRSSSTRAVGKSSKRRRSPTPSSGLRSSAGSI